MKRVSFDPRVSRMEFSEGENSTETLKEDIDQWETFEVFTQKKRGDQHQHVGIVHAPNNELALVMAKEQYARRGYCVNVWVVPTSAVTATEYADSDIFDSVPKKTHREAVDYKVKAKITKYLESKKTNGMSNKVAALKELLYKMADDQLILGHRNSEWTGIGPIIEEDIAFGSLAQDKTGHAWNLYQLLEKMGEGDPDHLGFQRNEKEYKCCHLVELPINGDFAFSLVRHFYFDHAESLRFAALSECAYPDLAGLAKKFYSEIKYHVFHANTWIKNLLGGNEESRAKILTALKETLPYALGIFEKGPNEQVLIDENLFIGEDALKSQWIEAIRQRLALNDVELDFNVEPQLGGRNGYHTEHLQPLLSEMTEVLKLEDDNMEW